MSVRLDHIRMYRRRWNMLDKTTKPPSEYVWIAYFGKDTIDEFRAAHRGLVAGGATPEEAITELMKLAAISAESGGVFCFGGVLP